MAQPSTMSWPRPRSPDTLSKQKMSVEEQALQDTRRLNTQTPPNDMVRHPISRHYHV